MVGLVGQQGHRFFESRSGLDDEGQEPERSVGVETGASNAYYQDPPPGPAALWRVRVGRGDAGPSDHRVRWNEVVGTR